MSSLWKYLFLILLQDFFSSGHGLKCLFCDGITHPRYCDVITTCYEGEVCFAESVKSHDGLDAYRLGCKYGNTSEACGGKHQSPECSECCDHDLCNAQLCGEQGYPMQRGPICYSCSSRLINEPCNVINFCNTDELCGVTVRNIFSDIIYTSSCNKKHVCDLNQHEVIVGKRTEPQVAEDNLIPGNHLQCCVGDLCNAPTAQPTPTLTTTTTPAPNSGTSFRDCMDILEEYIGSASGVYTVTLPHSHRNIQVYCDMVTDGGGWTVIDNRFDGSVNYTRTFSDYENGFGDVHGEFWLGLKNIYELSTFCPETDLRLDLVAPNGTTAYEVFRNFSLSPAPAYTLHLEPGAGTAGDGISHTNGCNFSTIDRDSTGYCAARDHGGWWYQTCTYASLHGEYLHPPGSISDVSYDRGMTYFKFTRFRSLKAYTMMLRRRRSSKC